MAYALHLITLDENHYTFAFDGQPTEEEIIKVVKGRMGNNFQYVDDFYEDSTYESNFNPFNYQKI